MATIAIIKIDNGANYALEDLDNVFIVPSCETVKLTSRYQVSVSQASVHNDMQNSQEVHLSVAVPFCTLFGRI